MRRSIAFAVLASLLAACVTVEPPPDPRGAVKIGQRIVVMVHQSPGPWIVADPDNKAETALKLLPLGGFLVGMQEDRVNEVSKELQPYLPRPRYDQAVEAALLKALKAAHGGSVQTSAEAGIAALQRKEWNAASDQLDWRRKYYFTGAKPSPRDYSKLLSLDDAVILEVNLSFGLDPDDQDRILPTLSAASRLYRADTAKMLWAKEDRLSDTTSSATLSEFRAIPSDLTDRLYALSEPLGARIASGFAREAGLLPAPPPIIREVLPETPSVTSEPPVAPAAPLAPPATEPVQVSTPPAYDQTPPPAASTDTVPSR